MLFLWPLRLQFNTLNSEQLQGSFHILLMNKDAPKTDF